MLKVERERALAGSLTPEEIEKRIKEREADAARHRKAYEKQKENIRSGAETPEQAAKREEKRLKINARRKELYRQKKAKAEESASEIPPVQFDEEIASQDSLTSSSGGDLTLRRPANGKKDPYSEPLQIAPSLQAGDVRSWLGDTFRSMQRSAPLFLPGVSRNLEHFQPTVGRPVPAL